MPFIVMTASTAMPASVKSKYRRVAVCEVKDAARPPAMISERAIGMVRIVASRERLHVGTTERGAYQVALRWANLYAAALNEKEALQ